MPEPNQPMDAGASKVPHGQPSPGPGRPRQERVRHALFGSSIEALDIIVKGLHVLGYADPNDWSPPLWSEQRQSYLRVLTKVFWLP